MGADKRGTEWEWGPEMKGPFVFGLIALRANRLRPPPPPCPRGEEIWSAV